MDASGRSAYSRTELWPTLKSTVSKLVPKGVQILILRTCKYITFYNERDFADVIKFKRP